MQQTGIGLHRRTVLRLGAAFGGLTVAGIPRARAAPGATPYAWSTVPFGGGGFIDGFLYHPAEKGLLYARTDVGGAYRFDAAKRRWIALLDHLGRDQGDWMGVLAMAIDPRNPARLYLACGEYLADWAPNGAVLRSDDRGATWLTTPLPIKIGGNQDGRGTGERLQVDPNLGTILFLASNQNGLYTSTDGGKTFASAAFPAKHLTLVVFDPASGAAGTASRTLYVGSADDKGALFASSDGGASFQPVAGLPALVPQRAVFDQDGNFYVTFSSHMAPSGAETGALFRRDAKSGQWKDISPMKPGGANPKFAYCGVDVDRAKPGTVIVSTMNRWSLHDDIFLSRDGGKRWQSIGAQAKHDPGKHRWLVKYLNGEDLMGHWIADVKIDPFDSNGMIYGTGYGLWLTNDLGAIDGSAAVTFAFANDDLEETVATAAASPPAGAALLVAMGDVAGAGWDDVTKPPTTTLFTPTTETNASIDFAELAPQYLVRTSEAAQTSGYLSSDGGLTWAPLPSSPRVDRNAKGDYLSSGAIAISAKGNALLWSPEKQPGFFSVDAGKSWKPSSGWPAMRDARLPIAADRSVDGVFYVFDREVGSILISVDAGATFKPVITGLPKVAGWQSAQLVVAAGQPRDLWLALPGGLFHARDANSPMASIKDVDEAWLVALGKAAPGKAYHAVYLWGKVRGVGGYWRSDDVGGTWVRINDDRHQFGSIRAMVADPTEHGTLYLGTSGRGVLVGKPAA